MINLELNNDIVNHILKKVKPIFDGYKESEKNLEWKKLFISKHARDRILERLFLNEINNLEFAKMLLRKIVHRKYYILPSKNNDTSNQVLVKITIGKNIPAIIILALNDDSYVLKTLYIDIHDERFTNFIYNTWNNENKDKDFEKMLLDSYFDSKEEKEEFLKSKDKIKTLKNKHKEKNKNNFLSFEHIMSDYNKRKEDFLKLKSNTSYKFGDRNFKKNNDKQTHSTFSLNLSEYEELEKKHKKSK